MINRGFFCPEIRLFALKIGRSVDIDTNQVKNFITVELNYPAVGRKFRTQVVATPHSFCNRFN